MNVAALAAAERDSRRVAKIASPISGRVVKFELPEDVNEESVSRFASSIDWESVERALDERPTSNYVDRQGNPVKAGPAPPAPDVLKTNPASRSRIRKPKSPPDPKSAPRPKGSWAEERSDQVDPYAYQRGLLRAGADTRGVDKFPEGDPRTMAQAGQQFAQGLALTGQELVHAVPRIMTDVSGRISQGLLGEPLSPDRAAESMKWNATVQFLIPGVRELAGIGSLMSIGGTAAQPGGLEAIAEGLNETFNFTEGGIPLEDALYRGVNSLFAAAGAVAVKGRVTDARIVAQLQKQHGLTPDQAGRALSAVKEFYMRQAAESVGGGPFKQSTAAFYQWLSDTVRAGQVSRTANMLAKEWARRLRREKAVQGGFVDYLPEQMPWGGPGTTTPPTGPVPGARPALESTNLGRRPEPGEPPPLDPATGAPLEPQPGPAPTSPEAPPPLDIETGLPAQTPTIPTNPAPSPRPMIGSQQLNPPVTTIDDEMGIAGAALEELFMPKGPEAQNPPVAATPPVEPPNPRIRGVNKAPRAQGGEEYEWVDPQTIGVRPDLQYKQVGITDPKANVTSKFKKLTEYDVAQGGVITVYEDEEGNRSVAHGHHRLDLAKRARRFISVDPEGNTKDEPRQVQVRVLRASEGWTPAAVRAYGAIENVRNGDGTAIDAALALRELNVNRSNALSQLRKWSINVTEGLGQRVLGLASLPDLELGKVRSGAVPEDVAAGIGSIELTDPQYVAAINAVQDFIADEKVRAREKPSTFVDGRTIAQKIKTRGLQKVEDPDNQGKIEFDEEFEQYISTVVPEQAIEREVGRELKSRRSVLTAGIRTEELEGETIDKTKRGQLVEATKSVESKLELLFRYDPEVQKALKDAAEQYATKKIGLDKAVDAVIAAIEPRSGQTVAQIIAQSNRPAEANQPAAPEGTSKPEDSGVAQAPAPKSDEEIAGEALGDIFGDHHKLVRESQAAPVDVEALWNRLKPEQQTALVNVGVRILQEGVEDPLDFYERYEKLAPNANIPPKFILYIQRKAREQLKQQPAPEQQPDPGLGGSQPTERPSAGGPGLGGAGAGAGPRTDPAKGVRATIQQPGPDAGAGGGTGSRTDATSVGIAKIITARADLTNDPEPGTIPVDLEAHLDEHQRRGAGLAIRSIAQNRGFVLADGTGVGKTRQLMTVAEYFRRQGKAVLIVAPANVLEQAQGQSYTEDPKMMGIEIRKYDKDEGLRHGGIRFVSYNSMENVQSVPGMVVILDEAHNIKRAEAGTWGLVGMELIRAAEGVLYATATLADKLTHIGYLAEIGLIPGVDNAQAALWQIGLQPRPKSDKSGGAEAARKGGYTLRAGFTYEIVRANVAAVFDDLIMRGMMIKREISLEGVEIRHEEVGLPDDYDNMVEATIEASRQKRTQRLHQRYHLEAMTAPETAELAYKEVLFGRSVIIFIQSHNPHKTIQRIFDRDGQEIGSKTLYETESVPKLLRAELAKLGISDVVEVHGGVTEAEIEQAKVDFQANRARVVIATTAMGGTGLNFDDRDGSHPRSIVFATPPYGGIEFQQAIGRIWRLTSKSHPRIIFTANKAEVTLRALGIIEQKVRTLGATSKTALASHPAFRAGMDEGDEVDLGMVKPGKAGTGEPASDEDAEFIHQVVMPRLSGASAVVWGFGHLARTGRMDGGNLVVQIKPSGQFFEAIYLNTRELASGRPGVRVQTSGNPDKWALELEIEGRELVVTGLRKSSSSRVVTFVLKGTGNAEQASARPNNGNEEIPTGEDREGDGGGSADPESSGQTSGQPGGVAPGRKIREFTERARAVLRSPDSPIPSGEPLIGQTVKDVHDLARIAQILRDPLRETVRFVFVDDAGRILAQEAYSYGAAGVTASPWGGGPPKGMPDYKGAAEFVADRLAMHGATGFYQIHNHPSQNPQPSTQDIDSQKIVGEKLRLAGLGGAAKGHLILDGDRYGFMSGDGTTATVAPLPKDLIDKAEVLFDPNVELPEFQTAAELAAYVKSWTSGGDQAIVLATTGVNGLRAVFEIPMDQLFVMLQRPQRLQATLRRLRRESGASRLYFFVPAALLNVMRLDPRFTKLIHLAINSDTIYSLRDLETGNSFNWPDKPPEPYEGYVEGLHYTGLNLKSYRDHVSAGFLRYMQGEVDPRPYKGERIVFRVPQSVVDADDKLFPADSVTKQGGLLEQWGFTLLTQHRLRHNAKNSGANFVQIWEGPDEPWAHEFLKEHGFKIDKTATRNFNAWNSDRGRSASPLGRLFSRQPYRSRRHIEPYPVRTPAGETRSGSPDFQSEVERLRGLVQIGGVRENLFEEGEGLNERIVELSKIAKKWHEQFGGGQKSAYNHLRKAWEAGHEEAKSAVELAGLPNVAQAPKKTGSLFGSSLDAELNGQGELFSDHWLPGLNKNDEGLERNLATFLAMRNRIKGNLSQLSSRWPGVAKAARRVANSTAQVMVMIRNAVPQIEAEGVPWELLAAFLSEGRLRGIEQRWWDLARYVEGLDDGDLEAAYVSFLRGPAAAIRMDAPVEAAIANGDLAGAQDMLFNAFVDAAERVTHLMSDAMFQQAMMSEDIQRGWLKYKELLEGQLAEIHALNEGIFSTALGPLDTYYPLSAMRDEETLITRTRDRFRRFRKPKNPANYFATGLASAYDTSVGAFAQKLEAAVRANNTAKLIELLEQNRLLKKLTPKERSAMGLNPTFVIDGIEYTAVIEEIKPPRIIIRGAETIQLPGEVAVIPEWLWQELQPIIKQKSRMDMGGFLTKLLQAVNTIGMGGPLDAVFHTSNVIGALVSGTPYAGTGWLAKSIGNTPLTKIFTAIANIIHTDPNTPEALAELMEMAKNGELPNRYGTETISAEYARATGAEQKVLTIPMPLGGKLKLPYTFGPLLYGPSGLDIRARLLMHRIAKQFNPNATPQELFEFTSQMGVYVRGLESDMVRWLKDTGVGPFATAGTTMWWNGVDIWLMKGPAIGSGGRGRGGGGRGRGAGGPSRDPMRNMKFRIAQQLSAGAIGVVAAWIALYFVYRKKWPWEEREARLLEIPLKPEHRESKLAKALYGPDTGTTAYVSFGFFAPMVMRGSRSIGVKGAFNTMAGGGTAGQGAEAAFRDMVNSALHPITSGPAFQGAFTMATGAEPYIIGTRDLQGNYTWKLIQTVPKKEPGWPQFWENIKHGIIHINSFAEDMLVSQGALEVPEWQEGREPTTLRAIVDIMFPRLLGTEQKPMRRQLHYQREILESRTSREGRRTGTYQRMRRRLTPGSSR